MRANELMIGDWVFIDHCSSRLEPCIGQVKGIDKNGEDVYTTDGMVDISLLKPIPLTKDILKANGFKYHSGERNMYGVETSPYYSCKGSPYIFCDGNPFAVWFEDEVPIRYVHELQHILRLCKIKKEIGL